MKGQYFAFSIILVIFRIIAIIILGGFLLYENISCVSPEQKARKQAYVDSIRARNDSIKMALDSILAIEDSIRLARLDSIKAAEKYLASIKWHRYFYVDEFGDPTNKPFIKTTTEGTFSNSAVRNEYLYVEIFVDKNSAGLFLHEYERDRPAEYFIGGKGEMRLKNQVGNILIIRGFSKWNNSGGLSISSYSYGNEPSDRAKLFGFLKRSSSEIKVSVNDGYSSTYSFIINTTGFTEAYNSL